MSTSPKLNCTYQCCQRPERAQFRHPQRTDRHGRSISATGHRVAVYLEDAIHLFQRQVPEVIFPVLLIHHAHCPLLVHDIVVFEGIDPISVPLKFAIAHQWVICNNLVECNYYA